ncbi:MAG: DUF3613 domain-containing protein [Burkholderiales bacterium]|nr:DUF3613 domain-containing protein [Burkholderiales bacterium]
MAVGIGLAAMCSLVASRAWAQERPNAPMPATGNTGDTGDTGALRRTDASVVGSATTAWLDLQRTNAAAAPALPTPGAQASLAYERYMSSFRTKIPASFGSTLSGEGNAGRTDYSNVGGAQPTGAAN